jgi:hypothetical protein
MKQLLSHYPAINEHPVIKDLLGASEQGEEALFADFSDPNARRHLYFALMVFAEILRQKNKTDLSRKYLSLVGDFCSADAAENCLNFNFDEARIIPGITSWLDDIQSSFELNRSCLIDLACAAAHDSSLEVYAATSDYSIELIQEYANKVQEVDGEFQYTLPVETHPAVVYLNQHTAPHAHGVKSNTLRQKCFALLVLAKLFQADPDQSDLVAMELIQIAKGFWDANKDQLDLSRAISPEFKIFGSSFHRYTDFLNAMCSDAWRGLVEGLDWGSTRFDAQLVGHVLRVNELPGRSYVYQEAEKPDENYLGIEPVPQGARPILPDLLTGARSLGRMIYPRGAPPLGLDYAVGYLQPDDFDAEEIVEKSTQEGALKKITPAGVDKRFEVSELSLEIKFNLDLIFKALVKRFSVNELKASCVNDVLQIARIKWPATAEDQLEVGVAYCDHASGHPNKIRVYKLPMPDLSSELKISYLPEWWKGETLHKLNLYTKHNNKVYLKSLSAQPTEFKAFELARHNLPIVTGVLLREFGEGYLRDCISGNVLQIRRVGTCMGSVDSF